jgi:hypothetical protein
VNHPPRIGLLQYVEAAVEGQATEIKFQLVGPAGDMITRLDAEAASGGEYRIAVTPSVERFRILMSGKDRSGWAVQRLHPVLFHAEKRNERC